MRLIYTCFVFFYTTLINIAALFNNKAKLFVKGRRNLFKELIEYKSSIESSDKIYWFHCASLGEFEQARPLIEKIKAIDNNVQIALSFYSPSGFEVRKNYAQANFIFYLPVDLPGIVNRFVFILKPTKVFFIKYEFWHNLLIALKKNNVDTYYVSILLRENHYLFNKFSNWFLKNLSFVKHFFTQNQETYSLLKKVGYTQAIVSGDTRFDRVIEIGLNSTIIKEVAHFVNKKCVVAGSTWQVDIDILFQVLKDNLKNDVLKLIIAPHEINEANLKYIETKFALFKIQRLSVYNESIDCKILIIDSIGKLSNIYKYAYFAYIGGGFGKAVHNTLEAAVYGIPVIIGPNYNKFFEIKEQIKLGNIISISNVVEFKTAKNLFMSDNTYYNHLCSTAFSYIQQQKGATQKIVDLI